MSEERINNLIHLIKIELIEVEVELLDTVKYPAKITTFQPEPVHGYYLTKKKELSQMLLTLSDLEFTRKNIKV
jgi:hypothetical protein